MEPGETENFAGLEAAFTCRLCEDRLDHEDLEMLPCGHAFCAACLRDETVDEYVCPECRVPFIVKDITKGHDLQEAIQPGLELLDLVSQLRRGGDATKLNSLPTPTSADWRAARQPLAPAPAPTVLPRRKPAGRGRAAARAPAAAPARRGPHRVAGCASDETRPDRVAGRETRPRGRAGRRAREARRRGATGRGVPRRRLRRRRAGHVAGPQPRGRPGHDRRRERRRLLRRPVARRPPHDAARAGRGPRARRGRAQRAARDAPEQQRQRLQRLERGARAEAAPRGGRRRSPAALPAAPVARGGSTAAQASARARARPRALAGAGQRTGRAGVVVRERGR